MRVAFRRQTEVAEILRGVARLLHRAQHQERDRLFFGLALDPFDQPLKMVRTQVVDRRGKAVAEPSNELLELGHLEDVGFFVHTIERRHLVGFQI
jgi:hypothetical protein